MPMTEPQPEIMDSDTPQIAADVVPANDDHMRVLEALLFASAAPLSVSAIRERMPENADVGGLLMGLQRIYEGRGVRLVEMDGVWAFRTAPELAESLQITREVKRKLSRAAMETLAIVAYHQPVTRAEIENIRGVVIHKGTLDVLMEMGWIRPGRRRETPGRPLTWVTTPAFMDHFGLESLTELPGLEELKASGLLDSRPAIDTLSDTGSLFALDGDEGIDEEAEEPDDDFESAYQAEGEEGSDKEDSDDESEDEYEEDDDDSDDDSDDDEGDE